MYGRHSSAVSSHKQKKPSQQSTVLLLLLLWSSRLWLRICGMHHALLGMSAYHMNSRCWALSATLWYFRSQRCRLTGLYEVTDEIYSTRHVRVAISDTVYLETDFINITWPGLLNDRVTISTFCTMKLFRPYLIVQLKESY